MNPIKIKVKNDQLSFNECLLERKKYAEVLTQIIENSNEGFVLAINNEWGAGKTTFIKMWQNYLISEKYDTIYFNAWENDFQDDPLIALISEIKKLDIMKDNSNYKKIIENTPLILKKTVPSLLKSIIEHYMGNEILSNLAESTSEAMGEIIEKEVSEYQENEKKLKSFKDKLNRVLSQRASKRPVIFFIDELDRCKPDYAVRLLEQIKHLFSIDNIVFVLSLNKNELINAINGYYGSEKLNSDNYLRRFIDLEFSLPKPNPDCFIKNLYSTLNFDNYVRSEERFKLGNAYIEESIIKKISSSLFFTNKFSLRDMEQIFSRLRLSLMFFKNTSEYFPALLFYLIAIRLTDYQFYSEIINRRLKIPQLQEKFFESFNKNINEEFEHLEALLIYAYNNYVHNDRGAHLILSEKSPENKRIRYPSIIDPENPHFLRIIESFKNGVNSRFSLEMILNKIELLDNFET